MEKNNCIKKDTATFNREMTEFLSYVNTLFPSNAPLIAFNKDLTISDERPYDLVKNFYKENMEKLLHDKNVWKTSDFFGIFPYITVIASLLQDRWAFSINTNTAKVITTFLQTFLMIFCNFGLVPDLTKIKGETLRSSDNPVLALSKITREICGKKDAKNIMQNILDNKDNFDLEFISVLMKHYDKNNTFDKFQKTVKSRSMI